MNGAMFVIFDRKAFGASVVSHFDNKKLRGPSQQLFTKMWCKVATHTWAILLKFFSKSSQMRQQIEEAHKTQPPTSENSTLRQDNASKTNVLKMYYALI